jgi:Uma2 family endonuclease
MAVKEKLVTAEQFLLLPEPVEGGKTELIDGRVVTMAPVGGEHGKRASRIDRALGTFVDEHGLGEVLVETGFILARRPDSVRGPEVSFTAGERLPAGLPEEGFLTGPPTLAVEVVSPNDSEREIERKVEAYLAAGSDRVWVVRPRARTVTVHRPGGESRTLGIEATLSSEDAGFAVEGFALKLADLFA